MSKEKINYVLIIKSIIILLLSTVLSVLVFAIIMYFLENGYEFSPVFATVSLGIGCFFTSLYLGKKLKNKGMLIGATVGGTTFILLSLISLIVNTTALTSYIFLKLLILLLFSLLGGICGVNFSQNQKYI